MTIPGAVDSIPLRTIAAAGGARPVETIREQSRALAVACGVEPGERR